MCACVCMCVQHKLRYSYCEYSPIADHVSFDTTTYIDTRGVGHTATVHLVEMIARLRSFSSAFFLFLSVSSFSLVSFAVLKKKQKRVYCIPATSRPE